MFLFYWLKVRFTYCNFPLDAPYFEHFIHYSSPRHFITTGNHLFYFDSISTSIEKLEVGTHTGNEETMLEFHLTDYKNLRSIVIHDHCFINVFSFQLVNLPLLESVFIDSYCFIQVKSKSVQSDQYVIRIENCPKLASLVIMDQCFHLYSSCCLHGTR